MDATAILLGVIIAGLAEMRYRVRDIRKRLGRIESIARYYAEPLPQPLQMPTRRDDDDASTSVLPAIKLPMILLALLALGGCLASESRSTAQRVMERTETPTPDGGKMIREVESTEQQQETLTKADVASLVQSGVAAAMSRFTPPDQPKLLGFTMPEIAGAAGLLWAGERGMAMYHRRRRSVPNGS